MVAPPPGLACDTRFRKWSVSNRLCPPSNVLFCLSRRRPDLQSFRSGFVSVRMIEVESECTTRLVPGTERDTNGRVSGPPPFPRPGRLARRVVGVNGGACAIAARRRQAPLTPATRRGRSPAEGAVTPNPLILGPLFRLVADRCDDLGFPRSRMLDVYGRLMLFRRH
jgi:hypothetical protein